MLDGAFTIFNNTPPRIVIFEMQVSLTSPDETFQAVNAAECFSLLKQWVHTIPRYNQCSIASALEMLCKPNLDIEERSLFANMGILNMFSMITGMNASTCDYDSILTLCLGLHTSTFQIQNSLASPGAKQRIECGLKNWKNAWNNRRVAEDVIETDEEGDSFPGMWKRVGFIKNAYEYWLLCCIFAERSPFGELEETKPVLGRYDETDMSQVNDLIAHFGNMIVE